MKRIARRDCTVHVCAKCGQRFLKTVDAADLQRVLAEQGRNLAKLRRVITLVPEAWLEIASELAVDEEPWHSAVEDDPERKLKRTLERVSEEMKQHLREIDEASREADRAREALLDLLDAEEEQE